MRSGFQLLDRTGISSVLTDQYMYRYARRRPTSACPKEVAFEGRGCPSRLSKKLRRQCGRSRSLSLPSSQNLQLPKSKRAAEELVIRLQMFGPDTFAWTEG